MKRFGRRFFALGAVIALVLSVAVAFAAGGKGGPITTKSIGTYGPADAPTTFGGTCPIAGCVGVLTTCAADEGISPVSQTFYYVRGICDDRQTDGLPACNGRYVAYVEECSRLVADERTVLTVTSRVTNGAFRICFSDPAAGEADCASATPTAQVIATGTTQSHTNHVSGTEILLGVGETLLKQDSKWTADGKKRNWSKSVGSKNVIHSQAQINGGTACPVTDPCGVSSTGVAADD